MPLCVRQCGERCHGSHNISIILYFLSPSFVVPELDLTKGKKLCASIIAELLLVVLP